MNAYHKFIAKKFEKEVNNLMKQMEERHPAKKEVNITIRSISKTFIVKDFFQQENVPQIKFLEDFGLLILKNSLLI